MNNSSRILLAALLLTIAGHAAAERDCSAEFRRNKQVCDARQDVVCLRRVSDEAQRCHQEEQERVERESARAEQERARQTAPAKSSGQLVDFNAGTCKYRLTESDAAAVRGQGHSFVWTGACPGGYANGQGIERRYFRNGRMYRIGKVQANNGEIVPNSFEGYNYFDGDNKYAYFKPGVKPTEIPPSQIPEWAREVVDGKERPAPVLTAQAPAAPAASSTNSNPSSQSQSSSSGGAARLPLRAAFGFILPGCPTCPDLPMTSVIAGNSESDLRRNAESLVREWLPKSTWMATSFSSMRIGEICNGPGYIVEARVSYRRSGDNNIDYAFFGACLDTEDPGKAAMQIKSSVRQQLERAANVSEWAYTNFFIGYVGTNNFRNAGQFSSVFAKGTNWEWLMRGILDERNISYDCNKQRQNDKQLNNMEACLSSGMRAIRN